MTTLRELWPEDPRWGEAVIPAPLGGVEDESYQRTLNEAVIAAKGTVAYLEQKYAYPTPSWWKPAFVETHPSIALLMQSVNQRLVFPSMYDLIELNNRVAAENKSVIIEEDLPSDVKLARLSMYSLIQGKGSGSIHFAHSILTEADKVNLVMLLSGFSMSATKAKDS